jgi:hypothetical protein
MFLRSNIPPLLHYHHRRRHSKTLPGTRIPMVRPFPENHQRPRPAFHFSFWKRNHQSARHHTKPVNCIPSSNRRLIRMKKPMDRTIPLFDLRQSRQMGQVAAYGNGSTQQYKEFHDRLHSKHTTARLGTPSHPRSNSDYFKSESRRLRSKIPEEPPHGHSGPE